MNKIEIRKIPHHPWYQSERNFVRFDRSRQSDNLNSFEFGFESSGIRSFAAALRRQDRNLHPGAKKRARYRDESKRRSTVLRRQRGNYMQDPKLARCSDRHRFLFQEVL